MRRHGILEDKSNGTAKILKGLKIAINNEVRKNAIDKTKGRAESSQSGKYSNRQMNALIVTKRQ